MLHVLKLGPVPLEATSTNVYLCVGETGEVAQPVFASTDVEGVRGVLDEVRDPEPLRCEGALAEAASELGLEVDMPSRRALDTRAAIAVFMAWGQRGTAALGPDVAVLMLTAGDLFWQARPWTQLRESDVLDVKVTGALTGRYDASVFGRPEHGYGVALYQSSTAPRRVSSFEATGSDGSEALGMVLDVRPAYAVEALQAAGKVPRVPMPIRAGASGPQLPKLEECLALAAAARAIAELTLPNRSARAEAATRGTAVIAHVVAPRPVLRN